MDFPGSKIVFLFPALFWEKKEESSRDDERTDQITTPRSACPGKSTGAPLTNSSKNDMCPVACRALESTTPGETWRHKKKSGRRSQSKASAIKPAGDRKMPCPITLADSPKGGAERFPQTSEVLARSPAGCLGSSSEASRTSAGTTTTSAKASCLIRVTPLRLGSYSFKLGRGSEGEGRTREGQRSGMLEVGCAHSPTESIRSGVGHCGARLGAEQHCSGWRASPGR